MSWQPSQEPACRERPAVDSCHLVIEPRSRDIGAFEVRRVLPAASRRTVGPFIFFDEMGPAELAPDVGMDVRPHPHIGLATVTYLFEGEILHRDSLGVTQPIEPGAVNWMVAGRGIVHSERSPEDSRRKRSRLHGIQTWIALPKEHEETEPSFHHHPKKSLPTLSEPGLELRLIAGNAYGERAPARVLSSLFYVHAEVEPGTVLPLPTEHAERAIYLVNGSMEVDGAPFEAGRMLVFEPDARPHIEATTPLRAMLLGGAPLDGPREIWWNFVSSSKERIETAKADWQAERFPPVPGEHDRIPLPT